MMIKNRIIYTSSSPWRFNISKAEGSYIWDDKRNKMLDFTSGWNVANLGWNHPEIIQTVINQAKLNTYNPMETTDPAQATYAKELTDSLPKGLDVVCRATGGTEANEEALKSARAYTKRKKIIGFLDTYHGQSFGDMSLGYRPEYVKHISPMIPGFIQIEYPSTYNKDISEEELLAQFSKKLENLLRKEDVAAIMSEAGIITGWGSTLIAPNGYLKLVRRLTKKYGTLLILDEVGTGFSRCGKLFGMELENVTPDIATFAKGISNGSAAIGAMVTSKKIGEEVYDKANLTSTFGWTPIACAASLKTLQLHKQLKLWNKAQENGNYIVSTLRSELSSHPNIGDISGKGMEIGIKLVTDKKSMKNNEKLFIKVINTAQANGLLLIGDGEGNIQLMPPLTTTKKQLDHGIEILVEILNKNL